MNSTETKIVNSNYQMHSCSSLYLSDMHLIAVTIAKGMSICKRVRYLRVLGACTATRALSVHFNSPLKTANKCRMPTEIKPKSAPSALLDKDWTQRRCFAHSGAQEFFDELHDLHVRPDDVWVVTLPKCGTTWMQELAWLVLNDYDFERAKQEPLELRSPFVEFALILNLSGNEAFKALNDATSPRLIKTHLPLPLLPREVWTKKPTLIYVFRNPKDALVSAYYFGQNFGYDLNVTLEEVVLRDLQEELETDALWNHVLEFYALRQEPWIHYTSFERMTLNLRKEISDVCAFLKRTITEEQMAKMLKHLSFDEMKNNPQCNHLYEIAKMRQMRNTPCVDNRFIRQGKVGGHKDELSVELIAKLDKWINDKLAPLKLELNDLLLLS